MMYALRTCLVLVSLVLLGCTGGHDMPYVQPIEDRSFADGLRAPKKNEPMATPDLTPEWIASRKTLALEVTVERTGKVAVLTPYSDRSGSGQGAVRIWRAADDSQIVLREGILIATRGLGHDLESTFSRTLAAHVASRAGVSGPHRLYLVTGENGIAEIRLRCKADVVGEETIEIVERKVATLHLRAECVHDARVIAYDFWVDLKGDDVWQSRQWAGPALGYIRTRLLKARLLEE